MAAPPDFLALLAELTARRVEFIVIGGVGAAIQGAPVVTFDLDLVHARTPDNLARLLDALQALDAFNREQPQKRLRPDLSLLQGPGHHLLLTRHGPLDLLGSVTGGRTYDDLRAHTHEMQVGPGLRVCVLDLAVLIALKEELGREKDRAALPTLRRTLEERERTA